MTPLEDRYIVDDEGCWIWQGCTTRGGCPQAWDGKRVVSARRYAYEQANNVILKPKQLAVCPCVDQMCINPAHTRIVVGRAAVLKAARKRGIEWMHAGTVAKITAKRRAWAKLDWEKVNHIRRREMTAKEYGALYGVDIGTVQKVWQGRIWIEPGLQMMMAQLRRAA